MDRYHKSSWLAFSLCPHFKVVRINQRAAKEWAENGREETARLKSLVWTQPGTVTAA